MQSEDYNIGMNAGTVTEKRSVSLVGILARYRQPSPVRSVFELSITAVSFVVVWTLAALAAVNGIWWGLLLTIPAAGFLVRLFVLQHDCGHGALFAGRRINDWIGRTIGILTLTPYDYWRRTHETHHATAGDLGNRGMGEISTLTVAEYRALPWWGCTRYWLYRHPIVLFGLAPAWLFIFQYRLPLGLMRSGVQPWVSTIVTNLGIALPVVILIWLMGIWPFLLVQLPITVMSATVGVWLFYVQHQFPDTHWSEGDEWNFQSAALHGSSHYDLPLMLRWFTGNIGIHHVHHLCCRVPFYRLPQILRDHPELRDIGRITLLQSLGCVRLTLWDEHAKRLISFRQARLHAGNHIR